MYNKSKIIGSEKKPTFLDNEEECCAGESRRQTEKYPQLLSEALSSKRKSKKSAQKFTYRIKGGIEDRREHRKLNVQLNQHIRSL